MAIVGYNNIMPINIRKVYTGEYILCLGRTILRFYRIESSSTSHHNTDTYKNMSTSVVLILEVTMKTHSLGFAYSITFVE